MLRRIFLLLFSLVYVQLYSSDSDSSHSQSFDGFLLRIDHRDDSQPGYIYTGYFIVPASFLDEKKVSLKGSFNKFLKTLSKRGAIPLDYPMDDILTLSCCEAPNVFQGYENYKNAELDRNILESYRNSHQENLLKIRDMKVNLTLRWKYQAYNFSIVYLKADCCYCRSFYGTDPTRFAYLQKIYAFEPVVVEIINKFKLFFTS